MENSIVKKMTVHSNCSSYIMSITPPFQHPSMYIETIQTKKAY